MHNAHLAMARCALDLLALEKVILMPTGSTHYREPAVASGAHRVAMLKIVLQDEAGFEIDARELAPGASGYTIDTLRELRLELGADAELWLLMGADQYARFEGWHRPGDIRRLVKIAVFSRHASPVADARVRAVPLAVNVSGSEIRARVRRGEDIAGMVPPAVADYIAQHRLYA